MFQVASKTIIDQVQGKIDENKLILSKQMLTEEWENALADNICRDLKSGRNVPSRRSAMHSTVVVTYHFKLFQVNEIS